MRIAFYTLGCKLNQCETEALASAAVDGGSDVVQIDEEADLYVINTCTVTSKAEQKARRIIRKTLREHPAGRVVVTGCYAQLEKCAIAGISERLLIVPQEEKASLLSLLRQAGREGYLSAPDGTPADPFAYRIESPAYHTRPFLKIQDGCNNRCAYCRVPLARGNSVSLPMNEVLLRLDDLDSKGFQEVVLTGVNITAYRDGGYGLEELIEGILNRDYGFRVRLSSLEPDMITEQLVDLFRDQRICPHFHIPVQSGSDAILAAMGRRYNTDEVYKAMEKLSAVRPDPFIAADIITGFPGETDEDFADTLRLVSNIPLSQLHVFPYSPRPGTRAAGMKNRVPERLSRERSARLLDLSRDLHGRYLRRWTGRSVRMLLLGKDPDVPDLWHGMSENYLQLPVQGVQPACGSAGGRVCRAVVTATAGQFSARFTEF